MRNCEKINFSLEIMYNFYFQTCEVNRIEILPLSKFHNILTKMTRCGLGGGVIIPMVI